MPEATPLCPSDNSVSQSQESTQPTLEYSQGSYDPPADDVWCSLIPCNPENPNVSRHDLLKSQPDFKYVIGRGSRKGGIRCDITFPNLLEMSRAHCTIKWNGDISPTKSKVVITNLNTTYGTWIGAEHFGSGTSRILHDFDVVAFGASMGEPGGKSRRNECFIARIWHMAQPSVRSKLQEVYDLSGEELGRGSYATVRKALHMAENRWYAVKLFPGGQYGDMVKAPNAKGAEARELEHLRREVDILKTLRHEHIVYYKEHFIEEGAISVVLEWLPGGDLYSYLNRRPDPLFEHEACRITFQICNALNYLHSMNVVHRDLKPHNVLLTDDIPPNVKVADFGMAKVLESLTVLQTKCGTPLFVAPEVLNNERGGYDKVVDSWSLGVMLFILLTKNEPFIDDAHSAIDWGRLRGYNLSESVQTFLNNLLEYDPRLRMTAARACRDPWLASASSPRCSPTREPSVERATGHTSDTVQNTVPEPRGAKRTRLGTDSVDDVSGSFSSMTLGERRPKRPVAKRKRVEEAREQEAEAGTEELGARSRRVSLTPFCPAFTFGSGEVPGLTMGEEKDR